MNLLVYSVIGFVIGVILIGKAIKNHKPKKPVNIIDGHIFPLPNDDRWKYDGWRQYCLGNIKLDCRYIDEWGTGVKLRIKSNEWAFYGTEIPLSRRQLKRYARAVQKYVENREHQKHLAVIEHLTLKAEQLALEPIEK